MVVADTNSGQWIDDLTDAPVWGAIVWPAEEEYTDGGMLVAKMGFVDSDFGAADIEGRVEGSSTLQPKGKWYHKAGTPTA